MSSLNIRAIAKGLVLGVGHEAWRYVKGLGLDQVVAFVERLDAEHFEARVPTLRHPIDIAFENIELTVDGQMRTDKLEEYATALRKIANADADQLLNDNESKEALELVEKARGEIAGAIERETALQLSYNVRYQQAYFRISNLVRRGRVRVNLSLRSPVRVFHGAEFVADLRDVAGGTQIDTSLWADVCIGRREGPLVRRIATREISCREAQFLAEVEHEVQVLVRNEGESRLSRMIPELIRRIAEGSFQS